MKGAGSFDYIPDSWITEFNYLARFHINKVIVLAALICSLELGKVSSEFMPDIKIAVEQ